MSVSQPNYQIGQTVRLMPEATGADWETATIAHFTEVTEGVHKRFEYTATAGDKTYYNVREEHIAP